MKNSVIMGFFVGLLATTATGCALDAPLKGGEPCPGASEQVGYRCDTDEMCQDGSKCVELTLKCLPTEEYKASEEFKETKKVSHNGFGFCMPDYVCTSNKCVLPQCTKSEDCGEGKLCHANVCSCSVSVPCLSSSSICCNDKCIEFLTDSNNCGACGNVCGSGKVCVEGECVLNCPAEQTKCGNECKNLKTDPNHCGTCGNICEAPENSTASCVDAECQWECKAGYSLCKKSCVDLKSDPNHCGRCNNVCLEVANSQPVCNNSACSFKCNSGYELCYNQFETGQCVDIQSDINNCGACHRKSDGNVVNKSASCVKPHAIATCETGTCKHECESGYVDCGGECVNLKDDLKHCGKCDNACPDIDGFCDNGTCACRNNKTLCPESNSCKDLLKDKANCGACGVACKGSSSCEQGQCFCGDHKICDVDETCCMVIADTIVPPDCYRDDEMQKEGLFCGLD